MSCQTVKLSTQKRRPDFATLTPRPLSTKPSRVTASSSRWRSARSGCSAESRDGSVMNSSQLYSKHFCAVQLA